MLRRHGGPLTVLTVLLLISWMSLVGQGIKGRGGGGGGTGSGTVGTGAANDLAVYTDTNEVGPLETGVAVGCGAGCLKFDDVTMTYSGGTFTFQDATPTTGVTTLRITAGAAQGTALLLDMGSAGFRDNGIRWVGSANNTLSLLSGRTTANAAVLFDLANNITLTSGNYIIHEMRGTFIPSSGTATFTSSSLIPTVNQTGTASGITRGLFVNPTLTAAADWRSIDLANVTNSHFAISTGTGKVSFGGPLALKSNTVSFSATPVFDGATGNIFHMELTGNVTSSTTSNLVDGRLYTFRICTDGTGGYTFAWPANVKGAMTVGTDADSCSVQDFVSDGTNLWARSLGVLNMPE